MKMEITTFLVIALAICVNSEVNNSILQLNGKDIFETILNGSGRITPDKISFTDEPCSLLNRNEVWKALMETGNAVRLCYGVNRKNVNDFNQLFQQSGQKLGVISSLDNCRYQTSEIDIKNCFVNIICEQMQEVRIFSKQRPPQIEQLFEWPRKLCVKSSASRLTKKISKLSEELLKCIQESQSNQNNEDINLSKIVSIMSNVLNQITPNLNRNASVDLSDFGNHKLNTTSSLNSTALIYLLNDLLHPGSNSNSSALLHLVNDLLSSGSNSNSSALLHLVNDLLNLDSKANSSILLHLVRDLLNANSNFTHLRENRTKNESLVSNPTKLIQPEIHLPLFLSVSSNSNNSLISNVSNLIFPGNHLLNTSSNSNSSTLLNLMNDLLNATSNITHSGLNQHLNNSLALNSTFLIHQNNSLILNSPTLILSGTNNSDSNITSTSNFSQENHTEIVQPSSNMSLSSNTYRQYHPFFPSLLNTTAFHGQYNSSRNSRLKSNNTVMAYPRY